MKKAHLYTADELQKISKMYAYVDNIVVELRNVDQVKVSDLAIKINSVVRLTAGHKNLAKRLAQNLNTERHPVKPDTTITLTREKIIAILADLLVTNKHLELLEADPLIPSINLCLNIGESLYHTAEVREAFQHIRGYNFMLYALSSVTHRTERYCRDVQRHAQEVIQDTQTKRDEVIQSLLEILNYQTYGTDNHSNTADSADRS